MTAKIICAMMALIFIYGAWSNRHEAKKRAAFIKENGVNDHDLWRYGDYKYCEGISKVGAAVFIVIEISLWFGWIGVGVMLK